MTAKGTQGQELLNNLEEIAREELTRLFAGQGLLDEAQRKAVAAEASRRLADYLSLAWGGQQLYIPKDSKRRAAMIYAEFDGANQADLARKYGVCVQTIYKVIKAERKARSMRQCSLL